MQVDNQTVGACDGLEFYSMFPLDNTLRFVLWSKRGYLMAVVGRSLDTVLGSTDPSHGSINKTDAAVQRCTFLVDSLGACFHPSAVEAPVILLEKMREAIVDVIQRCLEDGGQSLATASKARNHRAEAMGPSQSVEKHT